METKVKLKVQGLTNSQIHATAYALVLADESGSRRIPVIVGTTEAQSIAIAMERIITPRPLTHDLFVTFCHAYGIELKEVFIYKFLDGVFYSELYFSDGVREMRLDSRTSDAIAIALRVGCAIYTTEAIMAECGVEVDTGQPETTEEEEFSEDLEPEEIKDPEMLQRWLSSLDMASLQKRLDDAVRSENYEYAKLYQDELNKRK